MSRRPTRPRDCSQAANFVVDLPTFNSYRLTIPVRFRAVTRLTGASKNTVTKLVVDAGRACAAFSGSRAT